ncbi:hypothetical protein FJ872_19405 [Mesorhizobium sp. B2-5-9]|uniref:baseplate assembly protein n=1 Tax=Mesorhizobium sp. B2-5-9 TaxID=2589921 RepID=UPI00112EBDEE|nr:baseplate J/gp47 family protein [Mesorhizobium sp. B2-5-9]TPK15167.1 hypothetical protein FJ872_19405 [Mesorhizobium sp. B2-5-9]
MSVGRYASPELLRLGRPPDLASVPFETLYQQSLARLSADLATAGIPYNVGTLESDPVVILTQDAAYRDLLRRRQIDDAVAQTFLGSASSTMLDQRAADYGVLRKVLTPATTTTAAVMEDDESLRIRARLAWEALSVAGPSGAYLFHAAEAHPQVLAEGTAVYGPESGHVEPGEVLVVVQSRDAIGVPSVAVLDSVASRLDAWQVTDGFGFTRLRTARDEQSVRPLGAKVLIRACRPLTYYVTATIYVRGGPDPEIIRQIASDRLDAYLATRRRVGVEVPTSAILAALHVADANGLPIVEEVTLAAPLSDIVPAFDELAVCTVTRISVEVR